MIKLTKTRIALLLLVCLEFWSSWRLHVKPDAAFLMAALLYFFKKD